MFLLDLGWFVLTGAGRLVYRRNRRVARKHETTQHPGPLESRYRRESG
jgi:hypothetical protein